MTKKQPLKAQKGEIEFRKNLFAQQVEGQNVFEDEFDGDEISKILADRMAKTLNQMIPLKEKHIARAPFVEIGAERCQRSLVMENDLGLTGAAVDISFDMLKSCDYYREVFNKQKPPLRICCDANRLPFMSNQIPFVFCYQTLHHFPDPAPILKEVHRVLAPGGHFAVNEEPVKKILHLNLYKKQKRYSKKSFKTDRFRSYLDFFFAESNCNEVDYGVIENERITVRNWQRALSGFENKQIFIKTIKNVESELFNPSSLWKFLFAYLFGGEIHGLCRKQGDDIPNGVTIQDILICPECKKTGKESKLIAGRMENMFCSQCDNIFPIIEGVIFLFGSKKRQQLYPEIFNPSGIK